MKLIPRFVAVIACACLAVGCAPSMSPLYRDYERESPVDNDAVMDRIRTAVTEAGWDESASRLANVIATEPRTVNNWGLYRTIVSIEVAPLDDTHVRVFFHPYRKYITGGRSKLPFLSRSVRGRLLGDLNAAFEEQGLVPAGYALRREMSGRSY